MRNLLTTWLIYWLMDCNLLAFLIHLYPLLSIILNLSQKYIYFWMSTELLRPFTSLIHKQIGIFTNNSLNNELFPVSSWFSRGTYPQRISTWCSAWPWSSLTAWPCGRRTTWRRKHDSSKIAAWKEARKERRKDGRKKSICISLSLTLSSYLPSLASVCISWLSSRNRRGVGHLSGHFLKNGRAPTCHCTPELYITTFGGASRRNNKLEPTIYHSVTPMFLDRYFNITLLSLWSYSKVTPTIIIALMGWGGMSDVLGEVYTVWMLHWRQAKGE